MRLMDVFMDGNYYRYVFSLEFLQPEELVISLQLYDDYA